MQKTIAKLPSVIKEKLNKCLTFPYFSTKFNPFANMQWLQEHWWILIFETQYATYNVTVTQNVNAVTFKLGRNVANVEGKPKLNCSPNANLNP